MEISEARRMKLIATYKLEEEKAKACVLALDAILARCKGQDHEHCVDIVRNMKSVYQKAAKFNQSKSKELQKGK